MKNILILGGAGFIGTNLAIEAIKRGYKVITFDNLKRAGVDGNVRYMQEKYKDKYEFVWGDVRKPRDFDNIGKIDAIINMAANPSVVNSIKNPIYDFETNTVGVVNSLNLARKFNIPYLYASTNKTMSDVLNILPMKEEGDRFVWDKKETIPTPFLAGLDFDKNGVPESINDLFPIDGFGKYGHALYGTSKLCGELYCQEYHVQFKIPMVIFRMSCIYGLFQCGAEEQAWVDWFLHQIAYGDGKINIFGTGKQVRDVLDGRDCARVYLDALESLSKCNGEIFTLGGGPENAYSLLEAVKAIEKVSGKKAKLTFEKKRPADCDLYISSIKKVKRILGWEPTIGLEQVLEDMIAQHEKTD